MRRVRLAKPANLPSRPSWPFLLLLLAIAVVTAGGGSNRTDPLSLLYLRPLLAIILGILWALPARWNVTPIRAPLILLGCYALTMLIQLIPLPASIWASLPGHGAFAGVDGLVGRSSPWRPISLMPDLTVNSILALLPALTVLLCLAKLPRTEFRLVPLPICAVILTSVVLGAGQTVAGPDSLFYTYDHASHDLPVGLFANRNQQGVLLALLIPMLAACFHGTGRGIRAVTMLSLCVATIIPAIIILLMTGSRTGLAMTLVGFVLSLPVLFSNPAIRNNASLKWGMIGLALLPLILIAAAILLGNPLVVDRLQASGAMAHGEQRYQAWPIIVRMIADFFPLGSGYGTFQALFHHYEPDAFLLPAHFNHAHNDFLELALTGGMPAILVLIAFLLWFFRATYSSFRPLAAHVTNAWHMVLPCAGALLILLFGSLSEYPLRTPLLSALFALLCGLIAGWMKGETEQGPIQKKPAARPRRLAVAALTTVTLLWATVAFTYPNVALERNWRARYPTMVQTADWLARDANDALGTQGEEMKRGRDSALMALARDPINVVAVRTMGLFAAGRSALPQARALFKYAETLSRHDMPTQLWLIDDAVARNDLTEALQHFDRGLRTALWNTNGLLMERLSAASDDSAVRAALAPILRKRPSWRRTFLVKFIYDSVAPDRTLPDLFGRIDMRADNADDASVLTMAISRLVELHQYAAATRLYPGLAHDVLHNAGFEGENRFPPLDWSLTDNGEITAVTGETDDGNGQALQIQASGDQDALAAAQLIILKPGTYQLSAFAKTVTEGDAAIKISCATGFQRTQLLLDAKLADRTSSAFSVPATACDGQWIEIWIRTGPTPLPSPVEINAIAIKTATPAHH